MTLKNIKQNDIRTIIQQNTIQHNDIQQNNT